MKTKKESKYILELNDDEMAKLCALVEKGTEKLQNMEFIHPYFETIIHPATKQSSFYNTTNLNFIKAKFKIDEIDEMSDKLRNLLYYAR